MRRRSSAVLVERSDLGVIAENFSGRQLPLARSLWLALVELAHDTSGEVEATRAVIADYAGMTRKTLDEYAPLFEQVGLLRRERQQDEHGRDAANLWLLLAGDTLRAPTEGHADGEGAGGVSPLLPSSSTTSSSEEKKNDGEGGPRVPRKQTDELPALDAVAELIPDEMRSDAEELLRRKTRVGNPGHVVTPEEMARAAVALAEFNRQSGSDFGLGAHLRAIVLRIRERPAMEAEKHVRLVQSAWRLKWWERNGGSNGRRTTPAVIYGNSNVFEAVIQDAVDEAQGRPMQSTEPRRRFTRED